MRFHMFAFERNSIISMEYCPLLVKFPMKMTGTLLKRKFLNMLFAKFLRIFTKIQQFYYINPSCSGFFNSHELITFSR